MTQHTNSAGGAGLVVGIDPEAAFSVYCDDGLGRLRFVFEVGKDPKNVYLDPRPLQDGRLVDASDAATRARVNVAIDRVKAYFEAQGLTVEVD